MVGIRLVTKAEAQAVRLCEGCGLSLSGPGYPKGWTGSGRSRRRALVPRLTPKGNPAGVSISASWCSNCHGMPYDNPTEGQVRKLVNAYLRDNAPTP